MVIIYTRKQAAGWTMKITKYAYPSAYIATHFISISSSSHPRSHILLYGMQCFHSHRHSFTRFGNGVVRSVASWVTGIYIIMRIELRTGVQWVYGNRKHTFCAIEHTYTRIWESHVAGAIVWNERACKAHVGTLCRLSVSRIWLLGKWLLLSSSLLLSIE